MQEKLKKIIQFQKSRYTGYQWIILAKRLFAVHLFSLKNQAREGSSEMIGITSMT